MGLDGGTIISRNDVLRGQCWDLNKADDSRSTRGGAVRGTLKRRKLDAATSKVTKWTTCALSGQPLAAPVVACFLGRLYSKQSVLEWLLARAGTFADDEALHRHMNVLRESGDAFDHITSMKDVFPLAYQPPVPTEGAAVATAADGSADPTLPAPYTCPITEARCDRHPFVALVPCGHVFADRALREAGKDGTCPSCSTAFAEEDVIPLLPNEEQEERLRELLPGRRKQVKRRRKGGKAQQQQAGEQQQEEEEEEQQQQEREQQEPQQQEQQLGKQPRQQQQQQGEQQRQEQQQHQDG
ncbi:hypothetical protein COHA_003714 [Chlorella ohadii]|uniref:Replication termination factor 2 n=1 Tax=Chlorella ohadii TaxID=2649997 RepID=A0AAD5DUZ6_9CHLO|nr:hypothetical protein COHA_003714 [Chlorella ohadii]